MRTQTLLMLLAVMIAGCNGATVVNAEAPAAAASMPVELELRFDEALDYRDLRLRLLTVEDSRCATGLTCVWAGQMLAVIAVSRGNAAEEEVSLRTRVGSEPEVTSAFGYEFTLLSLVPHPKNNMTISRSEQTLRLMIIKP